MNNALIANNEIGVWDEPANNFYQPRIGIHLANTGGVEISNNIISFNLTAVPSLNYRGIRLENAAECVISGNSIANRVSDVGLQNQLVGIRLDNSSMPRINCNGLGNLGQGMQFVGNNDFVNLIENDFNQYDLGVMLGDGVNGTFIGDFQGAPGVGLDNSWVDDDADRVEGSVILLLSMPWYHRFTVEFENSFAPVRWNNNGWSPSIEPLGDQPSVLNQPCASLTDPSAFERSAGFASIAADTARYDGSFADEYLYLRKSAAFSYLVADTGRITMRSEDDEAYQTLYEVLSVTNISKIDSVVRLCNNEKWAEASALLESIEDTNSHEYNLKLAMGILIEAAIENRVLNSSDTLALIEIGNLHSLEGGLAVKIARASLQREIEDIGGGSRLYKNEMNKTSEVVKIWPNPTSDILQVNRAGTITFRVFDASMRLILSGTCADGIINVQGLNEGYYLLFVNYKNSISNEPIGFCKLK
jgi:hypothetical protein